MDAGRGDAHLIAGCLGDRIDTLAQQLLPAGHYGPGRRSWRIGSPQGEPGQSLCVWLAGSRRGRWRDYAADVGGDALDLVAQCCCRGDLRAALQWSRYWLGIGRRDRGETARLQRRAEAERDRRRQQAQREALRHAQDTKRVWLAAAPLKPGDLAWRYLAGRGIDLSVLPSPPAALRLHPGLYNTESGKHWPSLVAAISAADGRHVNTQRTWLAPQFDGRVIKAPLARPKLSMRGGYAGGGVRLWRGISGKPWRAMPEGDTILAGEGIEDVLTIVCARPEWRARAAGERRRHADAETKNRRADARRIWLAAATLRPGDLVWRYPAGRGIDLGALPRLPGALRCHPGLYHQKSGSYWPAMVAAISGVDADGNVVHAATQRTWLEPGSNGEVKKAALGKNAKMSLGPFREIGGAVHLARGADGRPWHKAQPGEWVAFSEGVGSAWEGVGTRRVEGMTPNRQRERPFKDKRRTVTIRITDETRAQLEAATATSDRSLAQEGELLLNYALDRRALLSEVSRLAYGREAGDLLRVLAREFARNGRIGAGIAAGNEPVENWLDDPFGYDQAVRAAVSLLERLRPPGDPKLPTADAATAAALEQRAVRSVDITLAAIKDERWGEQFADKDRNLELEELAAEVRPTLGWRIDRRQA